MAPPSVAGRFVATHWHRPCMARGDMNREARSSEMSGKRVLVVNDTQEILELFADVLGDMGFEVVVMSYAPRELERVREVKPDLIILDLIFGERELLGWQLLQKLKLDPGLDQVPVIVCSAAIKTLQDLEGHLTEQGVIAVVKPFNVDQLEEAVRRAMPSSDDATRSARSIVRDEQQPGASPQTGS
jgi:CheY-like chemotaxis protein